MTRQAPRWPLLTPHRENLRLQRRSSSDSPAGGHTRAFLEYCVQETTAAVGAEAPILFRAPLPSCRWRGPMLHPPVPDRIRRDSSCFPRASGRDFSSFALASMSNPGSMFSRSSLGVQGRFSLCSLFVRSEFGVVFLLAISPLRDLDSSSTVKARQAALKIFRAAGTALSFLGEPKAPDESGLPGSW